VQVSSLFFLPGTRVDKILHPWSAFQTETGTKIDEIDTLTLSGGNETYGWTSNNKYECQSKSFAEANRFIVALGDRGSIHVADKKSKT
jgi:hypothetical protein